MANKLMDDLYDTDEFLEISFPARDLFWFLWSKTDGFGMVKPSKKVLEYRGYKPEHLQELIESGLLIEIDGIYAFKRWNIVQRLSAPKHNIEFIEAYKKLCRRKDYVSFEEMRERRQDKFTPAAYRKSTETDTEEPGSG